MGKFIKTSVMLRAKLAEQFDVSVNWVKKSLCFKTNSKTAIKIREAALAAGGEELETSSALTALQNTPRMKSFRNSTME